MPNLNDKFIKSLPIPTGKNKLYSDDKVKGLYLRITDKDTKSFLIRYRINGNQKKYTIGGYPELSCSAARDIALQLKAGVARGIDPLVEKYGDRHSQNFEHFVKEFLKVKSRFLRESTITSYRKHFFNAYLIPKFGKYDLSDITQRELEIYHAGFESKPRMGNRLIEIMNLVFNAAIEWDILQKNPAKKVKKFKEHKRERYLSEKEIEALLGALQGEDEANVNAIKLILFTGSRKSEVLTARWRDFDLQNAMWIKPASLTKQNKSSHIPLNGAALQIIQSMKKKHDFLFYNEKTGTHTKDLKKFWAKICKKAEIEDCTIHDLRHTFASTLVNSGVALEIISKLVGHSNIRTTQRYSHLSNQSLKNATEVFSAKILLKGCLAIKNEK